ncbi:hypothetical protein N7481_002701 [Penicillium waksmanii]|uniref:uncharacterized protein n=1 Tax=Penicillium waksmanii TaxID=69791 RepID=UPI002547BC3A|nr:uncharacterized protein N7481_002701 [Penicillium waksmanii]KAJ5995724.1 hypothetical protein N7481_002701 [Penicillium waksmanii]
MAPLKVTVVGSSSISRQAERGVLTVSAKAEGPEKELVSQEVTSASKELHRMFTELSPKTESGAATADAPITVFSSTMLRTGFYDKTDKTPETRTRVHTATSSYSAIFRNFAKLGEVVGKLMTHPNVSIERVEWKLTDATIKSLHSESRTLAMQNAIEKAEDYARVVGRKVFACEINESDHGNQVAMLQQQQQQQQQMARSAVYGSGAGPSHDGSVDMTPQDIRYTGRVTVKFESEPEM